MAENVNFLDSDTENWTEANWHKVAKLLNAVDGVLEGDGSELAVIQATPAAMSVIVGTGTAWINGLEYDNTAAKTLVIDAADATYDRYDYIVIEADFSADTMVAKVVKGTAAASPVPPTLTQIDGVLWQFPLAVSYIEHGSTSVETADISDEREFLFGTEIEFPVDGGGVAIATGTHGYFRAPFSGTITGWEAVASPSGSIGFDIKTAAYADFPTTTSICGTAKPAITTAQKATSTTLTDWTTSIVKGQWYEVVVDSCTSITLATLTLRIRR